jgi:hypothetical protein
MQSKSRHFFGTTAFIMVTGCATVLKTDRNSLCVVPLTIIEINNTPENESGTYEKISYCRATIRIIADMADVLACRFSTSNLT